MNFLSRSSYLRFGFRRSIDQVMRSSSVAGNTSNMKFVWIDMEMTGLDVQHDKVLEVACVLTDVNLRNMIEGPHLVIHQSDSTLASMDPWCVEQHAKTGLVEECKKSQITENDAETVLLDFLMKNIPQKEGILAGNTVYVDRKYLEKYFPKVDNYLHYRIIDISSIKELCRSWYPGEFSKVPQKSFNHRAMADIKESVEELQYYRNSIFKNVIHNDL